MRIAEVVAGYAALIVAWLMFLSAVGMVFTLGWFLRNGSPGEFGPR